MNKLYVKAIFVTLVCALFAGRNAMGQEDPQYTHYMFNKIVYNPAVAGSENMLDATLLFRNQWLGFSEGTPLTQNLAVHMPINRISSGIGIHVTNDLIGVQRATTAMLTYSYIIKANFGNLAIGANGGIRQVLIDGSLLRSPDGEYGSGVNHNDNLIPDAQVSAGVPDFNLGLYFYRNNMYAGVSATHLIEPTVSFTTVANNTVDIKQIRHYYILAGYKWEANNHWDLLPSTKVKSDATKTQIDINALLQYNKNIWGGVGVRGVTADNRDAIMAMAGLNIAKDLRLGYSFDMTLSRIRSFSAGTHEFMLNYRVPVAPPPKPSRIIHCPRFL